MAYTVRTIDEIFQELLTDKQDLTSLDNLSDGGITNEETLITALANSKVAEWVLWLYNMAVQIHLTEIRTLTAVDEIEDIFSTKRVATEKWYIEKALEFQLDDTVIVDPITYQVGYATEDTDAQIIASCTTKTFANKLYLKVRRKDTNLLTTDEKNQFTYYMSKVKIAGTQITVENYNGDLMTLNMTIIYDGTKNLTDVQTAVESTIYDYLDNLEFDSSFLTSSLINKLQDLTDVIDPRFNSGSAIDSLGNSTDFTHQYTTNAGWAQVNPATPLSSSVTYIAGQK
jgi:hypothetical protein